MNRFGRSCVVATIAGLVHLAAYPASCWLSGVAASHAQNLAGSVAFMVAAWFTVWLSTNGEPA